jgi:sRNA-binding protein
MSDTQIIETGDSVKVKQVLDDAAMEAVSVHVHTCVCVVQWCSGYSVVVHAHV